jgi:Rrf2 family protein
MFFSKSFGYALRGILYVALMQYEQRKVKIDEIADKLSVPKHFLGKIMQELVKEHLLQSTKGPYGGFGITDKTLSTPLMKVVEITGGAEQFNLCVLQLRNCNGINPCPLHYEVDGIKEKLRKLFTHTTIEDLMKEDKKEFIKSLATI